MATDSHHPRENASREIGVIAIASLVALLLVGCIFGAVRWLLPGHTPDLGLLISAPATYIRGRVPYLALWVVATFAFASGLAFLGGWVLSQKTPTQSNDRIRYVSAWYRMAAGIDEREDTSSEPTREEEQTDG